MKETVVARRYAKALMEIGIRENRVAKLHSELVGVQTLFKENPNLWKAVSLPIWPLEGRRNVMREVLEKAGVSESLIRFFDLLVEKERITLLKTIFSIFQDLSDKAQNRIRGVLYTAEPLEKEAFEKVLKALAAYMDKEVILEKKVEPELIGGVKARIGEMVIDGSVRGQLDRYREKLLTG